MLKPTQEQLAAIKMVDNKDRVKGYALAGTGKTTLLTMMADYFSDFKILYLAFNKPIAEEAKRKMPGNVEVRTIHSLAYKHIGKYFQISNPDYSLLAQKMGLGVRDVFKYIRFFHRFTQSDLSHKDRDLIAHFLESEGLHGRDVDRGVDFVKGLYKLMFDREIPATHDFYLKLFERNLSKIALRYDLVLLDEAQDSNMVTCAVFDKLPGKKVMIGDTFQKIYGFRGAVNAMEKWEGDGQFSLTESFRFYSENDSDPLQVVQANFVLENFLNSDLLIKAAKIKFSEDGTTCILCRRNSSVVEALDNMDNLRTIRHPDLFFKTVFDVFHRKHNIGKERPVLAEYVVDLEELSDESGDLDIASACRLIKQYQFSELKFKELYKKACSNYSNVNLKDMVGTAHSCKGLEFDTVHMVDDFVKIDDLVKEIIENYSLPLRGRTLKIEDIKILFKNYLNNSQKEELNLLYMAYTRARKKLNCSVLLNQDYSCSVPGLK